MPFTTRERLRKERRGGAIIRVHVVHPVRVELDPAVVPIEHRGVRELAIGIRIIVLVHQWHRASRFVVSVKKPISSQP